MERQRLIRLLADEEAKLAALDDPPEKNSAALGIAPATRVNAWAARRRGSWSRHDPTAEDAIAWKRDCVAHHNQ